MSDYPDYTTLLQLIGTDIMVPIDIQGAYIMMPIDIQAQYVTLEMDIVAQTVGNISIDIAAQTIGNINIDIAASAITLDVNLKSQTANINIDIAASAITLDVNLKSQTANINIDIAAQTAGNLAVNITASAVTLNMNLEASAITLNIDMHTQSVGIYLQPEWAAKEGIDKDITGIYGGGGYIIDYTVPAGKELRIFDFGYADDIDEPISVILQCGVTALAACGGSLGASFSLTKPKIFEAGERARLNLNIGGWSGEVRGFLGGYEVSV